MRVDLDKIPYSKWPLDERGYKYGTYLSRASKKGGLDVTRRDIIRLLYKIMLYRSQNDLSYLKEPTFTDLRLMSQNNVLTNREERLLNYLIRDPTKFERLVGAALYVSSQKTTDKTEQNPQSVNNPARQVQQTRQRRQQAQLQRRRARRIERRERQRLNRRRRQDRRQVQNQPLGSPQQAQGIRQISNATQANLNQTGSDSPQTTRFQYNREASVVSLAIFDNEINGRDLRLELYLLYLAVIFTPVSGAVRPSENALRANQYPENRLPSPNASEKVQPLLLTTEKPFLPEWLDNTNINEAYELSIDLTYLKQILTRFKPNENKLTFAELLTIKPGSSKERRLLSLLKRQSVFQYLASLDDDESTLSQEDLTIFEKIETASLVDDQCYIRIKASS